MLYYDDEAHLYTDGWNTIPSVTQILSSFYGIDSRHYAAGAAERGSEVHEACADIARGGPGAIRPELRGYVEAYRQWLFDSGAKALAVEEMVEGDLGGRFAGRYDLLADLRGGRVLVDIKTGARAKWHAAQVAAYLYAAKAGRGMVLYLDARGGYREDYLSTLDLTEGLATFRRARGAYKEAA